MERTVCTHDSVCHNYDKIALKNITAAEELREEKEREEEDQYWYSAVQYSYFILELI